MLFLAKSGNYPEKMSLVLFISGLDTNLNLMLLDYHTHTYVDTHTMQCYVEHSRSLECLFKVLPLQIIFKQH